LSFVPVFASPIKLVIASASFKSASSAITSRQGEECWSLTSDHFCVEYRKWKLPAYEIPRQAWQRSSPACAGSAPVGRPGEYRESPDPVHISG
jgi:hypothetical protein